MRVGSSGARFTLEELRRDPVWLLLPAGFAALAGASPLAAERTRRWA